MSNTLFNIEPTVDCSTFAIGLTLLEGLNYLAQRSADDLFIENLDSMTLCMAWRVPLSSVFTIWRKKWAGRGRDGPK